jgi:hypothetical protein
MSPEFLFFRHEFESKKSSPAAVLKVCERRMKRRQQVG